MGRPGCIRRPTGVCTGWCHAGRVGPSWPGRIAAAPASGARGDRARQSATRTGAAYAKRLVAERCTFHWHRCRRRNPRRLVMSTPTAATPAELLASLVAALPSALPTTMTATGRRPTAGNDLYEAYLFGLVLTAARREGFGITLEDADGLATTLRLRRSPGRLPSGGP